ncbi:MAG: PQQ-binding-like beta-propeller repeat protein [Nocardiaceae bacterium]|nr:PQQ-binding-like beta-propeller repeat protein [Nocardiaceae bacterium]
MTFPPPPPPPQHTRGSAWKWWIGGVVFVLVAALVVGGVYWRLSRAPVERSSDQLERSFPTAPVAGWTLRATDIRAGSVFRALNMAGNQYFSPGFIDLGDVLVTSISDDMRAGSGSRGPRELIGVDSKTGELRWRTALEGSLNCATEAINGLLACTGNRTIQTFRISNGERVQSVPANNVGVVEAHDGALYSYGYDHEAGTLVLSRGTVTDPASDWRTEFQRARATCVGSGDSLEFRIDDGLVYFSNGVVSAAASAADGRNLLPVDVGWIKVLPGQGYSGNECRSGGLSTSVVVVDHNGAVTRTFDADYGPQVLALRPDPDRPVAVGKDVIDLHSGKRLWSIGANSRFELMVGHVVLVRSVDATGRAEKRVSAHSLDTGALLWTADVPSTYSALTDGERLIIPDWSTSQGSTMRVVAVNLTTGETDWTARMGIPAKARDGMAAVTPQELTYYPPP